MDLGQRPEFICLCHYISRLSNQIKGILDKARFYIKINLTDIFICVLLRTSHLKRIAEVNIQAWMVVDFKDPCLEIIIDK